MWLHFYLICGSSTDTMDCQKVISDVSFSFFMSNISTDIGKWAVVKKIFEGVLYK